MKAITFFSLLLTIYLLHGCQLKNQSHVSSDIPQLLLRPKVIGPEQEMAYVLDQYNKLVDKIKNNPADHESVLSLAELFMMEARVSGEHGHYYPASLQLVNQVLESDVKEALQYRALLDKASVLLSLHQFNEALAAGEKALVLNPSSADIYGVLVDANLELGEYSKAVTYADKMVSIRPDLRSYSRVSYLRETHGMVDASIEAMKMAVKAGYPGMEQTEWARLTLGHLYEHYGSQDSAMVQYEMALSARPNYPFAIAAMAQIYAANGEKNKADSLNAIAMNLIPEVSFYIHQAEWEKKLGNTDKSESITKEILTMMADDEKAGHKMGLELARVHLNLLDAPDKALDYALDEYKIRPKNIEVNKVLAEIYFAKGQMQKVQEHLTIALHTGSQDPEIKCLEGMMLSMTNRREEGEKILRSVFVEIPYLDCSYCMEAKRLIL